MTRIATSFDWCNRSSYLHHFIRQLIGARTSIAIERASLESIIRHSRIWSYCKYHHRCAIDLNIYGNVSQWSARAPLNQNIAQHKRYRYSSRLVGVECSRYSVRAWDSGECKLVPRPDILVWAEPSIIAFDIETCKAPLKYPDAEVDQVRLHVKILVIHLIISKSIIHLSL